VPAHNQREVKFLTYKRKIGTRRTDTTARSSILDRGIMEEKVFGGVTGGLECEIQRPPCGMLWGENSRVDSHPKESSGLDYRDIDKKSD